MARTTVEIEQLIEDEAASHIELAALQTNTSLVAVWRKMKKVFAFSALSVEMLFDELRAEIDAKIDVTEAGTIPWYVERLFDYQEGHGLKIEDNRAVYAVEDEAAKIIAATSVTEEDDGNGRLQLKIKVVEADGSGGYQAISSVRLSGISEYVRQFKFSGVKTVVESNAADELTVDVVVELNPLIFNADGSLILDAASFPVQDAMADYLKNLDFQNSVVYLSKLEDKIQEVDGVVDVDLSNARLGTTVFSRKIESPAGHVVLGNSVNVNYVFD